jgi:diguanylate cyclase (GGDEF)-like protein
MCRRSGELAATLFIDMNRFKAVNDTLGHDVGDQLLVAVALRLRAAVRAEDTVARIGGDEFVVFMPRLPEPAGAHMLARKLEQLMSDPFELTGHTLQVGASLGVAVYPDDGQGVDELLKVSDTRMYRAKEASAAR